MMQIMRMPGWGFDYCEARYYGRRHSVHIGPLLILWGQMTEAELRDMGDEPLPCPFCGSPAKLFWLNGARQATCPLPYAGCCGNDVCAPVPMWNRRATPAQPQKGETE